MTDFDEISRAIGRIEGKLEKVEQSQIEHRAEAIRQWEALEKIEKTLTAHRLKVAGIAATISGGVAVAWSYFKHGR